MNNRNNNATKNACGNNIFIKILIIKITIIVIIVVKYYEHDKKLEMGKCKTQAVCAKRLNVER